MDAHRAVLVSIVQAAPMAAMEELRAAFERQTSPTAAVLDAQSTRSSPRGGDTGHDAGKKVKGRQRHVVVDKLGRLLAVSVTAASVQDRGGAHSVIAATLTKYPRVETLFVDSGYADRCAQTVSQRINVAVARHPANRNVDCWTSVDQPDLFAVQASARLRCSCQAPGRRADACLERTGTALGDAS